MPPRPPPEAVPTPFPCWPRAAPSEAESREAVAVAGYGDEGAVEVDSLLDSSGGRGVGLASGSSTFGCSAGCVGIVNCSLLVRPLASLSGGTAFLTDIGGGAMYVISKRRAGATLCST